MPKSIKKTQANKNTPAKKTSAQVKNDPSTKRSLINIPEQSGINELSFYSFAETAPSAIFIYDQDRIYYVNKASGTITGYSTEEMLRMKFWDLLLPSDKENLKKRGTDRLAGDKVPSSYEACIINKKGEIRYIEYTAEVIEFRGKKATVGVSIDITDSKLAQDKINFKNSQRIKFQNSLLKLLKIDELDLVKTFQTIAKTIAINLDIERVSIWNFSDDGEFLLCETLYLKSSNKHTNEEKIEVSQYPIYFKALSENLSIVADDVYQNTFIAEFSEDYLKPLNILSMLDTPIRSKGNLTGVICCEHTNTKQHHWSEEEQDFVISITEVIANNIESNERRKAELSLTKVHEELSITYNKLKENEEVYRTLFEAANDAVFIMHGNIFISCNDAATRVFQRSKEELTGKAPFDFSSQYQYDGRPSKIVAEEKIALALSGVPQTFEWLHSYSDGSVFDTEVNLSSIVVQGITYLQAIVKDITERKKAQDILVKNESLLRNIIELSNLSMAIVGFDGIIEYINKQAVKTFGYPREELTNMESWWVLAYPEENYRNQVIEQWMGMMNKAITERCDIERREYNTTCKDGSVKTMVIFGTIVDNKVFVMFEDITERKKAEEAIRQSEEQFRITFENAPIGMCITNRDGHFIAINNSFCSMIGYSKDELQNSSFLQYTHPDDIENNKLKFKKDISGESPSPIIEKRYIHKDGHTIWTSISSSLIKGSDGSPKYMIAQILDITEHKKAEEALKASEEKYRTLIDSTDTGFVIIDDKGNVLDANQKYVHITGHDHLNEILNHNVLEWTADHAKTLNNEAVKQCMEKGFIRNFEIEYVHKDGTLVPIEISATVLKTSSGTQIMSLLYDISYRKQTEKALRESESRYRSYIDNAPDGVMVLDNTGRFIDANQATSDIIGYSIEELKQLTIRDILSEKFVKDGLNHFKKIIETGKAKADLLHQHKNGSMVWLTVDAVRLSESRILGFVKDITDRKKAEEKVENLNRVYALLSNINQTIVRTLDRQDLFNETCRIAIEDGGFCMAWIGLVNFETNKVEVVASSGNTGSYLDNINIDLDDKKLSAGLTGQAIINGNSIFSNDIDHDERMIPWRKDALEHGYMSSIALPLKLSGKNIGALSLYSNEVGFFDEAEIKLLNELSMDISFALEIIEQESIRINAEKALHDSEEQYRVITNNSRDIIVKFGTDGKISYISPSSITALGLKPNELIGQSVFRLFHPDEIPRLRIYQEELLKETAPSLVMHKLRKANGGYISFETNVQIIHDEDENIKEVVAVCRDMTEILKSQELRKEKEAAELANKAKSEFLANMSHEIRNPLNSIIGLSNMLTRSEMSSENKEMVESITISSNNLLNILNDILDFSKIEAKKVETVNANFEIENILSDIYSIFKTTAEQKNIELTYKIENDVPPVLFGDNGKLRQMLINLTSNAIKFTETGFVKIHVSKNKIENDKALLTIDVADSGIGIKKKDHHRLFQSFTQLDSSMTKQYSGTGLGLAIVKNYSELLKGEINFTSEFGKGSTFTLNIPFEIPIKQQSQIESTNSEISFEKTELRILLAEDDGINQLYMKSFLTAKGMIVDTAFNGLQAIEKYKSSHYDLILMDGQMPRMDGIEATRLIRILEKEKNIHTPIIAMTGYAVSGDKEKFISFGMDDYISKPVDEKRLMELIQKYTEK